MRRAKKKNYTVNRIKQSVGSRVFDVFLYLFMIAFTFCMVYPFWNQLVISLNEGSDTVLGGITFLPRKFTLQNYIYIFQRQNLPKGAAMSVARCVVGTFTSIVCTALLGYIVTIKHFAGRKFMRIVMIITMYFGGGMIPTYCFILLSV